MITSWSLDTTVPSQAECRRVRERAQRILTEARLLRDQLDQTGGLLSFALASQAVPADLVPVATLQAPRLQLSVMAA